MKHTVYRRLILVCLLTLWSILVAGCNSGQTVTGTNSVMSRQQKAALATRKQQQEDFQNSQNR
jgi:predicted small secreted protein